MLGARGELQLEPSAALLRRAVATPTELAPESAPAAVVDIRAELERRAAEYDAAGGTNEPPPERTTGAHTDQVTWIRDEIARRERENAAGE